MFFTKLFLHTLYGVSDHKSSQIVGANFTKHAGDIEMAAILPQIVSDLMDTLKADGEDLQVSYYKKFQEYDPNRTIMTREDDFIAEENAKNLLGQRFGIAALSLNGTLFYRSEKVIYHFTAPHGVLGSEHPTLITVSVRKTANKKYSLDVYFGPVQPKEFVFSVMNSVSKHTNFQNLEFM